MIELWIATTNHNKIKEIKNIIHLFYKNYSKGTELSKFLFLKSTKDLKNYSPPEETGVYFTDNAKIKSRHLLNNLMEQRTLTQPLGILSEDSGLEVESLNGAPGIYSARYSGPQATDRENNKLLLKKLENQTNRRARYTCALSFLFIEEERESSKLFEAHCEGQIAHQEKGYGGFGYDSLFIPRGQTQTFATLPPDFKQKLSHRRKALEQCLEHMNNCFKKWV